MAFNNVKPKNWYFVLDQVQFRTGLRLCKINKSEFITFSLNLQVLGFSHFQKLWVVDSLIPEHVELPHVLDFAVHLVQLTTWMGIASGQGGSPLFPLSTPSWLKVVGGVGWCPCYFSVTPVPIGHWTWILDWFGIGSRTTGLRTRGVLYIHTALWASFGVDLDKTSGGTLELYLRSDQRNKCYYRSLRVWRMCRSF